MRRIATLIAVAMLLIAATPAQAKHKPAPIVYTVDTSTLPFDAVSGFEESNRSWGVHKGAGYRIEVPADWNGELVMWAHGFRGTDTRLYFDPEEVPFREWLLDNGYAWAASTYSKNDYNVGTAVKDTRDLTKLFKKMVDKPDRTYIAGVSMGGHVTAASIERYRGIYDGAMPVCGVLGDYELFDYFLDFNVAAQELALGTSEFPVAPTYPFTTVPEIKANLGNPAIGGWPNGLNEAGLAFKQLVENRSGGDRPNFDEAWFFWNTFPDNGSGAGNFLFDLGLGDGTLAERPGVAVQNSDVFYDTDLIPGLSNPTEETLNADIFRITADKKARKKGNVPSPELTGKIKVPVLTMHNLGDLFVPFHMETEYFNTVAERGNQDLLVQRAIRGVNHCGFSTAEYETAFSDLVNWVETGVRPAGDNFADPAAIADPNFGCEFTDPTPQPHLFATPCLSG